MVDNINTGIQQDDYQISEEPVSKEINRDS